MAHKHKICGCMVTWSCLSVWYSVNMLWTMLRVKILAICKVFLFSSHLIISFIFPWMVSLTALFIVWITLPWLFKAFRFKAPFSFCYEMCPRMRCTLQKSKKLFRKRFVWDFLCRLAVCFRGESGFKEGLDRQRHSAPCFHLAGNLPVRRQENETLAVFSSPVEKALGFLHV